VPINGAAAATADTTPVNRKEDRMKRFSQLACLGLAVALLAACGGGGGGPLSKEDYAKKVNAVGETLSSSFDAIGEASEASSPEELQDKIGSAREALSDAAAELEGLTPPDGLSAPHAQLVAGLSALATDLDELASTIEQASADPARAFDALTAFTALDSMAQLQSAIEQLQAAGVEIG
jgi:hypothetical protein